MRVPNDIEKLELLQEACFVDSKDPRLVKMAEMIWGLAMSEPIRYFTIAHAVARDGVKFESDIKQFGHEDIASVTRPPTPGDALEAYRRGHDDCDAKARLFVALCLAAGFNARLWPLWQHGVLQHVAGEVEFNGQWHHAETILSRARFGEMHTDVVREANGRWKMT